MALWIKSLSASTPVQLGNDALLGVHQCCCLLPVVCMMVFMALWIQSPSARIPAKLGNGAHLCSSDMVPTYAAKYPTCCLLVCMMVIMALEYRVPALVPLFSWEMVPTYAAVIWCLPMLRSPTCCLPWWWLWRCESRVPEQNPCQTGKWCSPLCRSYLVPGTLFAVVSWCPPMLHTPTFWLSWCWLWRFK